jgi:hypothetical protein
MDITGILCIRFTLLCVLSFITGLIINMILAYNSYRNFSLIDVYKFEVTCTNEQYYIEGYKSDMVSKIIINENNLIAILTLLWFYWLCCFGLLTKKINTFIIFLAILLLIIFSLIIYLFVTMKQINSYSDIWTYECYDNYIPIILMNHSIIKSNNCYCQLSDNIYCVSNKDLTFDSWRIYRNSSNENIEIKNYTIIIIFFVLIFSLILFVENKYCFSKKSKIEIINIKSSNSEHLINDKEIVVELESFKTTDIKQIE